MQQEQVLPLSPETIKACGLTSLSHEQVRHAVFVKDISASASLWNVSQFFSFCGNVSKIVMDVDPASSSGGDGRKQFAVVVFDNTASFSTALLLGQARIGDSSITIYPYARIMQAALPSAAVSSLLNSSERDNSPASDSPQQRTQRASFPAALVIASLAEQGYVKSEELLRQMRRQAQELDQQVNFSNKVQLAVHFSRNKAQELDNSLRITQRLQNLKNEAQQGLVNVGSGIARTLNEFDQRYQIHQHANNAKQMTTKAVSNVAAIVLENDVVKQSKQYLSLGWNALVNMVQPQQQQEASAQTPPRPQRQVEHIEMRGMRTKPPSQPVKMGPISGYISTEIRPPPPAIVDKLKANQGDATIDSFIQFETSEQQVSEQESETKRQEEATVQLQTQLPPQRPLLGKPLPTPPVQKETAADDLLSFDSVPASTSSSNQSNLLSFD